MPAMYKEEEMDQNLALIEHFKELLLLSKNDTYFFAHRRNDC